MGLETTLPLNFVDPDIEVAELQQQNELLRLRIENLQLKAEITGKAVPR